MKVHARNTGVGGILVPIAMLLAAFIANEGQILLGLELDRVALAIFILPFLYGCAEAMKALLKLEGSRVLESLFGGGDALPGPRPPAPSPTAQAPAPTPSTSPPPPPPIAGGGLQ